MSAAASNSDVLFTIRASRDSLTDDLRSAERQIVDSAQRAAKAATTAASAQKPITLGLDTRATGDAVDREIGKILLKVREDAKKQKLQLDVEARLTGGAPGDLNKEQRDRFAATKDLVKNAAGGASEGSAGAVDTLGKIHHEIGKVAKAFVVVEEAVIAVDVGLTAINLISARVAGSYERQVEAAKAAEETIKSIPLVGDKILSIGKLINKYTIDLVTHESEYVEQIKKATAEQDKHIEAMTKRAQRQKDNIAAAQALVGSTGQEANPNESQAEATARKVADERAKLAEALKGEGLSKGGQLTETGKQVKSDAEKRINNELAAQDQSRQEAALQAVSQQTALELRAVGDVAGAERAEFVETLRQREVAAGKIGRMEQSAQQQTNAMALKNFDEIARRKRQQQDTDLAFEEEQNQRRINRVNEQTGGVPTPVAQPQPTDESGPVRPSEVPRPVIDGSINVPRRVVDEPRPPLTPDGSLTVPRVVRDQPRPVLAPDRALEVTRAVKDQPRPMLADDPAIEVQRSIKDAPRPVIGPQPELVVKRRVEDEPSPALPKQPDLVVKRRIEDQPAPRTAQDFLKAGAAMEKDDPNSDFAAKQASTRKQFNDRIAAEPDVNKATKIAQSRDLALAANTAEEKHRIEEARIASDARIREQDLRSRGDDYDADLQAFEAAADAKIRVAGSQADREIAIREKESGRAAMLAQRQRQSEDIGFEASEMKLRRTGKGAQADVAQIMRDAEKQVKEAGGDEERKQAIIARAEEQVRAVKPEIRQADVVSGSAAMRSNLFGGTPGQDKLTTIQNEALGVLKQIRDRSGAAVAT